MRFCASDSAVIVANSLSSGDPAGITILTACDQPAREKISVPKKIS
jgi:hypothetical protein